MFDMSGGMEEFFSGGFMRPFANRGGVFSPAIGFAPVIFAPVKTSESAPEVPAEASEQKIPREVDLLIVQRRELHALKFELTKAVKAEEYEKAAELRDKIRRLEGSGG